MRRASLILLMIIFNVGVISAQKEEFEKEEKDTKLIIKFKKTTLDLGEVEYGSEGTCNFIFQNPGNEPLFLTSVMTSCDCTASSWPKKPILSGKKDSIKIIYNTHSKGFFSKSVEVYSNADNSPVILRIKGKVIVPVKK